MTGALEYDLDEGLRRVRTENAAAIDSLIRHDGLGHTMLEVGEEVRRAEVKHRPMASAHEGYAVILEELDELKAEVWKGGTVPRDPAAMRKEAIEVAAMAVRFIRDVCDQCRNTGFSPEKDSKKSAK